MGLSRGEVVNLVLQTKANQGVVGPDVSREENLEKSLGFELPSWADLAEEEEDQRPTDGNPQRSWAEITQANRDPRKLTLLYVKPTEIISFSTDEREKGASFWHTALVGMVVGTTPSYNEIVKFSKTNWKDFGIGKVHLLPKGVFLFEFRSEEDKGNNA